MLQNQSKEEMITFHHQLGHLRPSMNLVLEQHEWQLFRLNFRHGNLCLILEDNELPKPSSAQPGFDGSQVNLDPENIRLILEDEYLGENFAFEDNIKFGAWLSLFDQSCLFTDIKDLQLF